MNFKNIEIEGIDTRDYPDFVDAFITYAEHDNGTPLTEVELDELNEDGDFVHNAVFAQLF